MNIFYFKKNWNQYLMVQKMDHVMIYDQKIYGPRWADSSFHILTEAVTLESVALLKTKTLAFPYSAFVGYILEVIHVLPPCPNASTIEWST